MAEVIIYSTKSCPFCMRAKEFFATRGIPFTELDVGSDRARAREMAQINPKGTVPTMLVNGRVVIGFVPELMADALKRPGPPKRDEVTQNLFFDPFEK